MTIRIWFNVDQCVKRDEFEISSNQTLLFYDSTGVDVGLDIHKQLDLSLAKLKTDSSQDEPSEKYGFMI